MVKSSPIQLEGWMRIVFCLDSITLPLEPALEAALLLQKGNLEAQPGTARTPRERSIETTSTDAGERLARRLEAVSQRMADLLRREVLEPSLAYASLMKKRGQQVPGAKTKALGGTRSPAPTNEEAVIAPDVSPPRLPPERPPTAFMRGETLEPSTARPKVRVSHTSRAV